MLPASVSPSALRSVALISAENEGENAQRSGGSLFLSAIGRFPDPDMRVRVRYWERPLLGGSKYITSYGSMPGNSKMSVSGRCPLLGGVR